METILTTLHVMDTGRNGFLIMGILLLVYFLLQIIFAFISTASWKELWKELLICLKKIQVVLLVLAINLAVMSAAMGILLWVMNYDNLVLLTFASVFIVVAVVFTRLFWIAALQELTHEAHSH